MKWHANNISLHFKPAANISHHGFESEGGKKNTVALNDYNGLIMFHPYIVITLVLSVLVCSGQAWFNDPLEFRFSSDGLIPGWYCVRVDEVSPPGWHDNYVCTNKPLPLTYRSSGTDCNRNSGNKCVHMVEPMDPVWADNQLCVSGDEPVELVWSWCGTVKGMKCVLFYEPGSSWFYDDNYLCWREY